MDVKVAEKDIKLTEKEKAKLAALSFLEKKFGKGTVMALGDGYSGSDNKIPLSLLSLNAALGGGVPTGRIIEVFGQESSGKTTLSLSIIAKFQTLGKSCVFVDTEHTFDPSYAKIIGVDIDNLIVSQPDYGEQALEIVETLIRSGGVDLVVVDSVAALTPKAEIDGDMGDSHMGLHARLMSQAMRKLTALVSKTDAVILFTNQMRSKIGITFGSPDTTTGGNALKFYCSVRIEVKRIGAIKEKEEVVGSRTLVKIVKNKVAPPFKQAEFDIMYDEGISVTGEVIDLGVKYQIIDKSGSWYTYREIKMGQGRENARQFLKENRTIFDEIYNKIKNAMSAQLPNQASAQLAAQLSAQAIKDKEEEMELDKEDSLVA